MGNLNSKVNEIECEDCYSGYGSKALLEVYHHGELGGRIFCINCFKNNIYDVETILTNVKKNVKAESAKCANCSYVNKHKNSHHNLKIHWTGKYDNVILCEKCLFNKSRRKKKI